MQENVIDDSQDKVYFTQICNFLDDLDLSPLAFRLYFLYKRWANKKDWTPPGVKQIQQRFKIGHDAIRKAKLELVKHKLIKIKTFDAKLGKPDEVRILDVWKRNLQYFETLSAPPALNEAQVEEPVLIQAHPRAHTGAPPCSIKHALKESNKERNIAIADEKPKPTVGVDRKHPAIDAILRLTSARPPKKLYERLAEAVGHKPDEKLLKECFEKWIGKGWNPQNFDWVYVSYATALAEVPTVQRMPFADFVFCAFAKCPELFSERYGKVRFDYLAMHPETKEEIASYEQSDEYRQNSDRDKQGGNGFITPNGWGGAETQPAVSVSR